ncbi:hypothetical protein JTE90_017284 [Oedothorax gibbosus]|uniref:Uncharacterized protein n=1 Tax=Oedothorax gibbosus TaxID=931172 RepID=A0AAV6VGM1_9ARAC|nr:hypothetical protein JTE90_017284 [Oedothorax gibbosus]
MAPDTETPTEASVGKNLYPAAPLHYVQIGPHLSGDYKFGYDTGKGPLGQSFREEIRLADGTISGTYGVVDELGHRRVVHYSAGKSSQRERIPKRISDSVTSSPPRRTSEHIIDSVSQNSRYVENLDTNLVPPPRYTSPMASLELIDRLVPKTSTTPVYRNAEESMQRMSIVAPFNNIQGARNKVSVASSNVRAARNNVDSERNNARDAFRGVHYVSSSFRGARNVAYDSRNYINGARNNINDARNDVHDVQSLLPALQSQIKNIRSSQDYYQASNVRDSTSNAATKSLSELTHRRPINRNQRKIEIPETKIEDRSYDTASALRDIKRPKTYVFFCSESTVQVRIYIFHGFAVICPFRIENEWKKGEKVVSHDMPQWHSIRLVRNTNILVVNAIKRSLFGSSNLSLLCGHCGEDQGFEMLCLVISFVFLPSIFGQQERFSKHKETQIYSQHNQEAPKHSLYQYSSIGSFSGSTEDERFTPVVFSSKNYIAQNGHGAKFPGIRTFEDKNVKFQSLSDFKSIPSQSNKFSGVRTFEDKNVKFQSLSDLTPIPSQNSHPSPNNVIESGKVHKFREENELEVPRINSHQPLQNKHVENYEFNKFQHENVIDTRPRINNVQKLDQQTNRFEVVNDVSTRHNINKFSGQKNYDEKVIHDRFQKQRESNFNEVSTMRDLEERQRFETHQKLRSLVELPKKERQRELEDFQERPRESRYPDVQKRPVRPMSQPASPRQRRPKISRNRMREGRRLALPEVRRGPKVVKYIADTNGFAIREDLLKPLQDTIDRTHHQESRRKIVMTNAGPRHGSRVVTSAIRVAGQSGKFLPQIFDMKSRKKNLSVDRLAKVVGAREVVI